LDSVSRVQLQVTGREQQQAVQRVREILAAYRQHEDLIAIGAYRRGSQPLVDLALAMDAEFQRFLRQGVDERTTFEQARGQVLELAERAARMRS
jgi:flagellum-specific ATP synthase